ncbi:MAG: hypothetical protein ACFE85_19720 [Candidatus Hodarchaeota archaeon]
MGKDNKIDVGEIFSILRDNDLDTIPLDFNEYYEYLRDVRKILEPFEQNIQDKMYMQISKEFYESQGVIENEAAILATLEQILGDPFFKNEKVEYYSTYNGNARNYVINQQGRIIQLAIDSSESFRIDMFPKEICSLKQLKELYLINQNIIKLPDCLFELQNLEKLDLSYNPINELPDAIKKLKRLKFLRLENMSQHIFTSNILNFIRLQDIEGKILVEDLYSQINNEINSVELKNLNKEKNILYEQFKKSGIINQVKYPSKEILDSHNYMYMILWILEKNKICSWTHFTKIIAVSTLASYLDNLISLGYIFKIERGIYGISSLGKNRLKFLTHFYYK